jgi:hypothetical protein
VTAGTGLGRVCVWGRGCAPAPAAAAAARAGALAGPARSTSAAPRGRACALRRRAAGGRGAGAGACGPATPAERARRAQAPSCTALEALSLAGCHGVTGCGLACLAGPCGGAGGCAPRAPRRRARARRGAGTRPGWPGVCACFPGRARRAPLRRVLGCALGPPPRPLRTSAAAVLARRVSDTRARCPASKRPLTTVVMVGRQRGRRQPRGHGQAGRAGGAGRAGQRCAARARLAQACARAGRALTRLCLADTPRLEAARLRELLARLAAAPRCGPPLPRAAPPSTRAPRLEAGSAGGARPGTVQP